jgi:TonB-dependent starch-binding outer membrane protein SusC
MNNINFMRKKRWKTLITFSFLSLIFQMSVAQNRSVTGVVRDENGETIIGANIKAVGVSSIFTITDMDGKFTLDVPDNVKKLNISYVGMKSKEVAVKTDSPMDIMLQNNNNLMDEVVVIGYGTAKRKDLTGSVSSIGENDLKDVPITSAASALEGRLAGVSVVTTQGSPDAQVNIRVRGGGSITQDNSPLFIVDGFPVSSINDIPPGDIASVDVLKDASSTAIYGAKGANGVILITTKGGKSGRTVVTFNSSIGYNKFYKETPVLSPYEYVYYQKELDPTDGASWFTHFGRWEDVNIYKSKKGTDWQAKMFDNTGVKQSYNLSISGGDTKYTYSVNYTRDDEKYIMATSNYRRDNLDVKFNRTINKDLKFDFNSRLTKLVINGASVSSGSKLRDCVKYPCVGTLDALTENDLGGEGYSIENLSSLNDPMYNIRNEYKKQDNYSNSYNAALNWNVFKGFSWRVQGTYAFNYNRVDDIYLKNTGTAGQKAGEPVAFRTYTNGKRWSAQSLWNYNIRFKKSRFESMFGLEFDDSESDNMVINSDYYPIDYTAADVLAMWNNGTSEPTYTTISEPSRTSSYFGRINYVYNDRYYLTMTARADGTNVFAPSNKWGFFPAVAAAWRVSEEKFMKEAKSWLSNLKVRLSYGETGNARVGSYWRQTYNSVTSASSLYYQNEIGQSCLQPSNTLRNEKLTWETTYAADLGFDVGLCNDRFNFVFDLYHNTTKNLILQMTLPSNSGYSNQYRNIGQTTNKGLEISFNGTLVNTKKFSLNMNMNVSFNANNVDKLYGNNSDNLKAGNGTEIGSDNYRVFVGHPVGLMYGYVSDGYYSFDDFTFNNSTKMWEINKGVPDCSGVLTYSGGYFGPGHMKLKQLKKTSDSDNKVDADNDRKIIGRALPRSTGGFGFNATFYGFDLVAMFNWSYGNDVLNINKIDYTSYSGAKRYQNLSREMSLAHRFTTIDPQTGHNIYYGQYADPTLLQQMNTKATLWHPIMNTTITTDWAVEDGSFLRFSNLTLGYTLPRTFTTRYGIKSLRFYMTANNVFCWTEYSGQDPEVSTSTSNLTPGMDCSAYPKSHTYIFGVNVTF